MKKNTALKILLVTIAITIGFFQEQIKININYQLERAALIPGFFEMTVEQKLQAVSNDSQGIEFDYYYNHGRIPLLYSFSQSTLVKLKWFLTVFFVVVFFVINVYLLRMFTASHRFTSVLFRIYLVVFVIAFLIFVGGKVAGAQDVTYSVARRITGTLQSVIPAVILYIYFLVPVIGVNTKKTSS